ncbi:hypothetical protein GH741_01875 [Aquibacillus halophilus]|uniref:Uncharacterized protein n=1 Tax=Aquibacillus halophilus TaxID=930132 RepID=A0A6A8D823_9BACI|nr:hypothetical protein [Aquibacillus halophilus]MRH41420.1 hypothetical protein [Aquibacillus halophilus]
METKEKSLYIGLGVLIGFGIGLLSFKNIKIINIGHLDKITLVQRNDRDED